MSSTRKYCSAFMIAVYGSGSPIIPAAYRPACVQAVEDELEARARPPAGLAVAALLRDHDEEQAGGWSVARSSARPWP